MLIVTSKNGIFHFNTFQTPKSSLKRLILLGGFFLFFSCQQEIYDIKCVKKNNHIFTPIHLLKPHKPKLFSGYVIFDESALFNSLGEDNKDWNKLCGVYNYYDFKMNKNAFILAWRPNGNRIQLCAYENIDGVIFQHKIIVDKKINEKIFYSFLFQNGKYVLFLDNFELGKQENPIIYKKVENIFTWFGGNRKAPQDICIIFSSN